jgi:hypothetical protein
LKKRFNAWSNYFLIGIACLHITLFFIPLKIDPGELKMVESNGKGETYFVISPNGTLVGWGGNDYRLVANGYLLIYPYFARKTILRNVIDVEIGYHCAMAVDKNRTLWGWGSYPLRLLKKQPTLNNPTKIMEDVVAVEVENYYAAVVKTDGSLWVWGETQRDARVPVPEKIMDNVKSIYTFGGNTFAIKSNNELYAFTYSVDGMVRYPTLIATGISAVSAGFQNKYQFLTIDEKVFLYSDDGYDDKIFSVANIQQDVIADNVRALCYGGIIKTDNSYWRWEAKEDGESVLVKRNENVAYAEATANGTVIVVTIDGKIYAEPILSKWPTIPQSMRTVSPILRTLFLSGILIKLFVNKYFFKKTN